MSNKKSDRVELLFGQPLFEPAHRDRDIIKPPLAEPRPELSQARRQNFRHREPHVRSRLIEHERLKSAPLGQRDAMHNIIPEIIPRARGKCCADSGHSPRVRWRVPPTHSRENNKVGASVELGTLRAS